MCGLWRAGGVNVDTQRACVGVCGGRLGVCGDGVALDAAPVGALLESLVGEVNGALVGALAL